MVVTICTFAETLPGHRKAQSTGRRPKIAVPTRTIVAPSAIAASRSARHAHRQRVEREAVARSCVEQRAQRAMRRALRVEVGAPARESPSGRAAAAAAAPRPPRASAGDLVRRDAALGRLAADVDLQADLQRRQVGRPLLATGARAIFSRSTEWTQSKCSATTRVLLLCSGPIRCHSSRGAGRRSAAILSSASCT